MIWLQSLLLLEEDKFQGDLYHYLNAAKVQNLNEITSSFFSFYFGHHFNKIKVMKRNAYGFRDDKYDQ